MSDVSADVLAEGWVVPEDIAALSVFSFARCFGFILQGELVSAFVESFLVRRGGLNSCLLAATETKLSYAIADMHILSLASLLLLLCILDCI